MIGRLNGVLADKQPPFLLLDVQGVGYEVEAPMSTFYKLPETGGDVVLHIHLVVRDDAHLLYGFATLPERGLFRDLIKVSGVGPRLALAILSGMDADAFVRCVQDGDSASLVRLPGIGKRTAERLIVEMRDRVSNWQGGVAGSGAPAGTVAPASVARRDPVDDAASALIALGYRPQEASRLVNSFDTDGLSTEDIIRLALRPGD